MDLKNRLAGMTRAGAWAFALALPILPLSAATFEEQRASVSSSLESQPEDAIVSLLKAGIAENRPAPAVALAEEWLRRNLPKNPVLLMQAARAAELAGEAKNAVAFHQQALKLADPKSPEAGASITAIHTLLIYRLDDPAAAYSFGLNEAPRLAVNPRFRQFDRWFLDEAIKRNDPTALAKRLNATTVAGVPADLLNAQYSKYFFWLLDAVDGYCDQQDKPLTQDLYDTVKDLCDVMTHSEELKLRLDWAVSVKAYNLSRFGDQTKSKIGVRGKGRKPPGKKPGKKPAEGPVVEEKKLEAAEDMAPPIAEASALLEKFPQHAMWVMTGWAGGGVDRRFRGDLKNYWPHEADAKMVPILAALSKLPPADAAQILYSAEYGGYFGSPAVSELKSVLEYLNANPALMQSRNAPAILGKEWQKLTPEEAQKLAPLLAQSIHPSASVVRAIAVGGKDYDKVMAALLGSEVWRLGPQELNHLWPDQLWQYCGRPGGGAKRDEWIGKTKALAASLAAGDAKKEDPADKRIAAFRNLWADYKSPLPKIPAVRSRMLAVLKVTPEVVAELLKDTHPEAQRFVREALESGIVDPKAPYHSDGRLRGIISSSGYFPWLDRMAQATYGGMGWLKNDKNRFKPHPLEPVLRAAVSERLAQGKIEPWLAMAWINAQFPENNAEQAKLMQDLLKSPAWAGLPFHVHHGAREWFGKNAMTPGEATWLDAADPALLCKDLIELPKEADANTAIAAVTKAMEGARKSPVFFEVQGLDNLAAIPDAAFADEKLQLLLVDLIDGRLALMPTANFGIRLFTNLSKRNKPDELLRTADYLWKLVSLHHRTYEPMLVLAESSVDSNPSVSHTFALEALGAIERHRQGHTWFKKETDVPRIKSFRSKAASKLGLIVIPVQPTDPAYPVYQAQAEWMSGNDDSAWTLLTENWDAFAATYRELSVPCLMWALQRTIYSREEDKQEFLVKSLLGWAGEAGSPLTPAEKAGVEIAYGDIAIQRGQLREAHEIFVRIQKNEAYAGLPVRHQATLRRAATERMAKDFDGALNTLRELSLERIPELWSDIRFAMAEVHYDMEEFEDAKDDIDAILARDPNHPDAKILLGKVQLKRQKLMEATEVELGSNTVQPSLVPGQNLKVTLNDPTLAVSGAGTEIEIKVWAKSGDHEQFFLRQFGDQKTKFRGEVATALGTPSPDDGKLQVIGDDEVFYAYTERFLKKMNRVDEKRGGPITVSSDATLIASARKLLTDAEQRIADMQEVMDQIKGGVHGNLEEAAKARLAARVAEGLNADGEESERRVTNLVKPGNPIHVRVVDPDRSRTAGIDELVVSATTSSGDSISRITLKETGTHTGWFEGSIPTTGAQAMAFAPHSEPGRDPNMVISPADYPAWRPVPTKDVAHEFNIDFNDNIPLGEMNVTAAEPNAKITSFLVQTGMSKADMTTVAAYPKNLIAIEKPWAPSVTIMNDADRYHNNNERSVYDLREIQAHLDRGWMSQQYAAGVAENVAGPSAAMTAAIPAKVKWLRQNQHPNSHVIYRFRGYFHERSEITRRFKVLLGPYQVPANTHPSVSNPPQFLLAVNGQAITSKEKPDQLEGEINLRPGLHRFEIWATGWDCTIGFGRSLKLLANVGESGQMADCPDSFFDPATFPSDALDHRSSPATVEADADGKGFKVKFADGSRGRMLRLIMLDHEGPVPALNKIALTKPDGSRVLPVAADFAELNRNGTLEMLVGDRVSIRYVDDRFVTKTKENHERFLGVSFTDARVEFADMEDRLDERSGKMMPFYERLVRFEAGEPLSLAIHDADMDVSGAPDKVKVSLSSDAAPKEFEAVETGDSTGVFRLVITPVSNTPTKAGEFQVGGDGTITATYLDRENNRPGIPVERLGSIRHAKFTEPAFRIAHATVSPWVPPVELAGKTNVLVNGFERMLPGLPEDKSRVRESIRPRWLINHTMLPADTPPEGGFSVVHGRRLHLEVVAPQLALRPSSVVTVYAQTDAGRAAAANKSDGFDITVPGTIRVEGKLPVHEYLQRFDDDIPEIGSYFKGPINDAAAEDANDRFAVNIPLIAGMLPASGVLNEEQILELKERAKDSISAAEQLATISIGALVVRPGETIHLGFRYTSTDGAEHWTTASAKVITHPAFDLMNEEGTGAMTSAYVGENLNLRVVDLGADKTDEMDEVNVLVQAKSGAKVPCLLRETGPHTGIFKGVHPLTYAKEGEAPPADGETAASGVPVVYGDTVAARYTDANGVKTETLFVTISKGADGNILPFSKVYEDEEIAMRTQFSLAEAYLETAKRYRGIGETELADRDYATAKLLLAKAMDEFTDAETRAHAEYLLGSLTMEEAIAAQDAETKETRFRAALSRFMTVTGTYPDTIHASRAQYRIATIYEALAEPEIAAQEYVKLAYKYPDSEYLATSMARLGSFFLKKANAYEEQAKPLLARAEEDKDAAFEGKALQKLAEQEYLKTASIFGRLQQRFPSHELSGQAGLRAGQAYMRAGRKQDAIDAFQRVISEDGYDGPSIRAQAMYWTGMCYQEMRQEMAAYSTFKRLTYDFPESEWAAFARGQLSQERLLKLENKLEIERLESGR